MTVPFSRSIRLRGKSPRIEATRYSYSIFLRDNVLNHIKLSTAFNGFKFAPNTANQIQPEHIPYCGVYFISEAISPDGDINAGEVRFRLSTRLGFSVVVQNNDSELADRQLDLAYQVITTKFFSDPNFYNNLDCRVQGFSNGSRVHVFGSIGNNGELPIAELRLEITFDLGTITYPPEVLDDLEIINVKTRWPAGGTEQEIHDTQQVEVSYNIDQGS